MKVPLLDLAAQYRQIKDNIERAVEEVFASQRFILGPKVSACEAAIADYVDAKHAVGVSSGTDALLVALMAEGIGPGDEVITTPYSFFATVGAIVRLGAVPVFADIDPETYNINPELVASRITARTKAIIAVHLYGQPADMDAIMSLGERHGLCVIEDAAQAIGAEYKARRAGSIGHYGCFSFFPSKNLGAAGDGGMVVTNDEERAAALRRLRNHGAEPKYYHKVVGGNFRLDALQAAVVLAKLPYLDGWTAARGANAERYDRLLAETGLVASGDLVLPGVTASRHVFNQYVIRARRRDALRAFLADNGVGSEVYYPVPLHRQECFAHLGCADTQCPEADRAASETLALPVFPELTQEQAGHVAATISRFMEDGAGE